MTDLQRWEQALMPDLPAPRRIDLTVWANEFRDVYKIAEALCRTPFVPQAMLGKQADVAAAIMKGRELGLDPFDALGSIYIVHGRVGFYAEFMRRRIVQAGHTLTIIESTENRCIIEGTRKDTSQKHRATFTAEAARKAGIDLGRYPADKLIARATSRLCTQAFPDVLSGTLIAEDLIDGLIPPTDETPTATAQPGPPVQRKRATRAPKAARTQPKPTTPPQDTHTDDEIAELLDDEPNDPDATARAHEYHAARAQNAPWSDEAAAAIRAAIAITTQPSPAEHGKEAPPAGEPHQPDEPATKPQNRKMHALFRQLDLLERADRLTITSHILGYTLETSSGLTKTEANTIIDTLESWIADSDWPPENRILEILNTASIQQAADDEQEPEQ